jgi:hypothetical protein
MAASFESSRRLIARANHHFIDFKRQVAQFVEGDVYRTVVEPDIETGEKVYKVKFLKPFPDELESIAFDLVGNLRPALDHAVFVVRGGKGKNIYFPIADREFDFENEIKRRCKSLPSNVVDLFRRLKPYRGGNDLLWALHKLANTNKHEMLCPLATLTDVFHRRMIFTGASFRMLIARWDRVKNEIPLYRVGPKDAFEAELKVSVKIGIANIEVLQGKPAVAVFDQLIHLVESIVRLLEVEAGKLTL